MHIWALGPYSRLRIPAPRPYDCPMAPAPKRNPASGVTKRPRLSQAEATARMLNATAQLLLENVPREVTVAQICEKAGVHPDYVVRYFGSREELLCQAIEAAFLGVFLSTNDGETTRLNLVLEGKADVQKLAQARMRTIAYLLGCGVGPERFQLSQKMVLESVASQSTNPNVQDRTRVNLVLIGTLIVQAMNTFADVNDMTEQQRQDVLSYIGYMSQNGETVQATLGWDTPKAKPQKRK